MRTALLALGLLVAGCGASRPLTQGEPFRPPAELRPAQALARYQEYCLGLRSFPAAGELEVRDLKAARVRRLGVRLVAARPGRLYVKGSVAVVTALEVVADGSRFWFQVPSKMKVWTGAEGRRIVFERESLRSLRLLFYDAAGDLVTEARLAAWRDELPGDVTLLRREGYEARLTFDARNPTSPCRTSCSSRGYRIEMRDGLMYAEHAPGVRA